MPQPFKLLVGFLTLLVFISLQLWLVPFGIHADLALAALIAFTFIFNIWELIPLVLVGVFILNWYPGLSVDIIVFALIPFAVYGLERWFRVDIWIGYMVAVTLGLFVLYLVTAPALIVSSFASFFLDVILCLAAGQAVLWGMESSH